MQHRHQDFDPGMFVAWGVNHGSHRLYGLTCFHGEDTVVIISLLLPPKFVPAMDLRRAVEVEMSRR